MADILIKNGHVLTMDDTLGDLPAADIHVQDDRIVAVGKNLSAPGAEIIDASGKIVSPGFVDGHRHVWQSLLRGASVDWTLPQYMVEARSMYCGCYDADDAYLANYLGGLESIAAGITTVVDHSHLQKSPEISDALVKGLTDSGVGGIFCYALQNVPDYLSGGAIDAGSVCDMLMRMPDEWHEGNAVRLRDSFFKKGGRLRFGVALPEATPYLPAGMAQEVFERALALQPRLLTGHWDAGMRDGVYHSTLSDLLAAGAFAAQTSLTHCNHLNESDLKLLSGAGIGISTCPDIECGMGLGPMPTRRFIELGGSPSLGLDLSSYVRADMLKQARLLLQTERKALAEQSSQMPRQIGWPARAVLELVTIMGARSIGLADEIGSLTPGKRADVLIVAPNPVSAMPMIDPVASLLFYADASDIETVLVHGEVRKRAGQLVGVDVDRTRREATEALSRIQDRYRSLPRDTLQEVWAGMF